MRIFHLFLLSLVSAALAPAGVAGEPHTLAEPVPDEVRSLDDDADDGSRASALSDDRRDDDDDDDDEDDDDDSDSDDKDSEHVDVEADKWTNPESQQAGDVADDADLPQALATGGRSGPKHPASPLGERLKIAEASANAAATVMQELDGSRTSSGALNYYYRAGRSRVNSVGWCSSAQKGGWVQVDLGKNALLGSVATMGTRSFSNWVTGYKLATSVDGVTFTTYKATNGTSDKIFAGNSDQTTVVSHALAMPANARYVRLLPTSFHGNTCMRFALYRATDAQAAAWQKREAIRQVEAERKAKDSQEANREKLSKQLRDSEPADRAAALRDAQEQLADAKLREAQLRGQIARMSANATSSQSTVDADKAKIDQLYKQYIAKRGEADKHDETANKARELARKSHHPKDAAAARKRAESEAAAAEKAEVASELLREQWKKAKAALKQDERAVPNSQYQLANATWHLNRTLEAQAEAMQRTKVLQKSVANAKLYHATLDYLAKDKKARAQEAKVKDHAAAQAIAAKKDAAAAASAKIAQEEKAAQLKMRLAAAKAATERNAAADKAASSFVVTALKKQFDENIAAYRTLKEAEDLPNRAEIAGAARRVARHQIKRFIRYFKNNYVRKTPASPEAYKLRRILAERGPTAQKNFSLSKEELLKKTAPAGP